MRKGQVWYSTTCLLALQLLLVVTGGLVRLTGSGLGCPTWPKCTVASYKPVESQPQLHAWIEFGNRLLTFALFAAAIWVLFAVRKRKNLKFLAWLQLAGILGQGVLGGITVLTKLNPIPVASHMLLSMLLIAGATSLQYRSAERKILSDLLTARILALIAFGTLTAGTIVTGSGPHAGDWQAPRFHFDLTSVAKIHGFMVTLTTLITIYLIYKYKSGSAKWLLVAIFGQAFIGLLQWWLGLPQFLVALHLLGASLFWFATWRTRLSFKYQINK